MPDILVPFSADHIFYGIVAGSFAWGVILGVSLTWWATRQRVFRARGMALKDRLGSAH